MRWKFSLLFVSAYLNLLYSLKIENGNTVINVAKTHISAVGKKGITIKDVKILSPPDGFDTLGYIVNLSPQGFIVISTDTRLPPVIAYSFLSNFPYEESRLNILLDMLRNDLMLRLQHLDKIPDSIKKRREREWLMYLNFPDSIKSMYSTAGQWPPEGSTSTGGWIETTWHQLSPFNDSCPIDYVTSERCLTGCVATAMAQIVNYWEYPPKLHFDDSDNYLSEAFFVSPPRRIYIDCSPDGHNDGVAEHEYEHDPSMDTIDYDNADAKTWAELNFACGVSVQMMYSSKASGAYTMDVATALKEKFGYESAKWMWVGDDDFYPTLKDNMKNAQPAEMSIYGTMGGHAIVCDGLKEIDGSDDQYHLNFGWGPTSPRPITECWYVLPDDLPPGLNTIRGAVVNIKPPETPGPKADFITYNPRVGCPPHVIYFFDRSKGTIASRLWNFGDGTTSTEENPVHVYENPGHYSVSLTVSDGTYTDVEIKKDYIIVLNPPSPSFTAYPRAGSPPLRVKFKNTSTGDSISSFLWDFGDGTTSTQENPVHVYEKEGRYTVSLKVYGKCGEKNLVKENYIFVGDLLIPEFEATPISGCSPLEVHFQNKSLGNPSSFLWDFGDGTTSTQENPVHVYEKGGRYTVSLTVKREDMENTVEKNDYIHVYQTPQAEFRIEKDDEYQPLIHHLTVKFYDSSEGNPCKWFWDFGDGVTSTEKNPIHTYTSPGEYTVKLRVENNMGCSDEVIKEKLIKVSTTPLNFALYSLTGKKSMIVYDIPKVSHVRIDIYSSIGTHLATIEDCTKRPGRYYIDIEKLEIPSGVYFIRLSAPEYEKIIKITFIQ